MSEWQATTLGDVCELKRGYDLPQRDRRDGPYPIISSSGTTGYHAEAKAKGPGVVTGRYGTLGEVFLVNEDFWPLNTSLYVRDFKGNEPRFLAALLRSMDLAQHDGAAAVPGLNRNQLHQLPVLCPDRNTQLRISNILGAIDDLIENNRRRIELLEEMAQAIYREWFVHFRYPGHEDATFVDSPLGPIPEGWEVRPFSEVATFLNGFAFKPSHWSDTGRPIIKIKELKNGIGRETPRCDEREVHEKYWVEPGDLLFSWSADLGVYRWSGVPGLLNQHLFVVNPVGDLSVLFLQHSLDASMPQFWDRAQGTTMRHIKRAALAEVTAVVPTIGVVGAFTDRVEPIDEMALRLTQRTRELTSLRNLLLPKLVTGEIDVSELDFGVLVEAAS